MSDPLAQPNLDGTPKPGCGGCGWWALTAVLAIITLAIIISSSSSGRDNDPAEVARAHESGAKSLCEDLVRDRIGSAEFRTSVTTTGTSYVVTGNADTPGRTYPFRCEGAWHQDSDGEGGEVRIRLTELAP